MNNNIKVTCWGSRGSGPAPYTEQMEYGGNTSCFTIETGQMLLVLDGGTGLAALGREMMKNPDDKRDIHIFISHLHLDHIIGIPPHLFLWREPQRPFLKAAAEPVYWASLLACFPQPMQCVH